MRRLFISASIALLLAACSRHPSLTPVEQGNRDGVLHLGNGSEPRELDPEITAGIPESNIERALYEPLVNYDGKDLHPVPGVAQSWDTSPDGLAYTFHLRPEAKWSNGTPLTAQDFVNSYRRTLSPRLAAEFSYFLWVLKNAQQYNNGGLIDFGEVGVHALDEHTLRLDLEHPAPYLLNLIAGRTWYPVYLPAIEKTGALDDRGNQRWTRPDSFVGNGPFVLTEWTLNKRIVVKKNPQYWDAARVRLNEIDFYPMDNNEAEEHAFVAGQLHKTYPSNLPPAKIDVYRRDHPELLHIPPYMGSYYFMLNTTRAPLDDARVRRALSMCVDRDSIVRNVTRAGQVPASSYVPPGMDGYACAAPVKYDPDAARKLLAETGHPGGVGLPAFDLLLNTSELHKQIAEAVQQMWKKELGVTVNLHNEEWKVYLDDRKTMNYTMARAGWIATYLDPTAFLELFLTNGLNNNTGFANPEYDRLIAQSHRDTDPAARKRDFNEAETILLDASPVIPLYFYTNPYLITQNVQGWDDNLLDFHPYQDVWLKP